MSTRAALFAYIKRRFDTEPDYPFAKAPEAAIFRHQGNRKWFAAVLRVRRSRLGLQGNGKEVCEVVDLKCDPVFAASVRHHPGILPGYHMNKKHWITVLLDGSVDREILWMLVGHSFNLTAPKGKT